MTTSTRLDRPAAELAGSAATGETAGVTGGAQLGERSGHPREVRAASSLEGETVLDRQGETLGEIEEIMLEVQSGRIAYAVLAVGGFLGIGERYFAVPWRALALDADRKCFVLDIDRDTLAGAPASFERDDWPAVVDESWAADLHRFYGVEPYSK